MREENSNFYRALGIDLRGRAPETIQLDEIDAAFAKAETDYVAKRKTYRENSKSLHPDSVRHSEAAKNLSPDDLEKLIDKKTKDFTRLTDQWNRDESAYQNAKNAVEGLKNPEIRARHDERLKWNRGSGAGNGGNTGGGPRTEAHSSQSQWWKSGFKPSGNDIFRTNLKDFINAKRKEGAKPDLSGFSFFSRDVSGMDLEGCKIKNPHDTNFKGANLKNTDFSDQSLWNCVFDDATQLEGANFSRAYFSGTNLPKKLKNVNFNSVDFSSISANFSSIFSLDKDASNFEGRVFENCNFDNTRFSFANIKNSTFKDCSFKKCKFSFNAIHNVVFEGGHFDSNLGYAELHNVTFKNVAGESLDLMNAKLKDVKIEGSIKGLKLQKHQLKHVDLTQATIDDLRVFDFFGAEIKDPFGKGRTFKDIENNASKERGFFERMVSNSKGELHAGKVAAIATGIAVVGGVIYQLSKKDKSWQEGEEQKKREQSAVQNR